MHLIFLKININLNIGAKNININIKTIEKINKEPCIQIIRIMKNNN